MKINVVIPLAGEGSRFKKDFPDTPKPLINVYNLTLIEIAIKSMNFSNANLYFIKKKYEDKKNNEKLNQILNKWTNNENIFTIDQVLKGPVRTCLTVEKYIDKELPMIIANCDQYINWDINNYLKHIIDSNCDGSIVTYKSNEEKNSFAKIKNNLVKEIVEKKVISNDALVGIHHWKKSKYFFNSAKLLIKNIGEEKEAFISETYNFLLNEGLKINSYDISNEEFDLIGTLDDFYKFKNKYSKIF